MHEPPDDRTQNGPRTEGAAANPGMDPEEFRRHAHALVDWVADYLADAGRFPVLSPAPPGAVRDRLPVGPPAESEPWADLWRDFQEIVLPGVTHWNHPRFFAYFPANNSAPSVLGELLSAALGVNAMVWQSCPAATELEERVMDWLRQLLGLPPAFRGVIQDTASTATLCALLCARERATGGGTNAHGFAAGTAGGPLRVYTSAEAHSSVEKGAKIAGFGAENVVRVAVDAAYAMDPADLERRIAADRAAGRRPCAVVATVGTTSSTALDPLAAIAAVAERHDLWLHVDAALAGSAALLPEKRDLLAGAERAHSLVFNPHKWLFTNFDCSAFFCREPDTLVRTFAIDPEYLKTDRDRQVTNFRDWGVPLGRRFRALKLWFVLRSYGVEGLRARLREHLALAQELAARVDAHPDFERLAPVPLQTVCFRWRPRAARPALPEPALPEPALPEPALPEPGSGEPALSEPALDALNKRLLDAVNATGRAFLSHTRLGGRFTLRFSIGQTQTRRADVEEGWDVVLAAARALTSTA